MVLLEVRAPRTAARQARARGGGHGDRGPPRGRRTAWRTLTRTAIRCA